MLQNFLQVAGIGQEASGQIHTYWLSIQNDVAGKHDAHIQ